MNLLRPVGLYRFLTPVDVLQKGDLGRLQDGSDHRDRNWEEVPEPPNGWGDPVFGVGSPVPLNRTTWEFIRPIPGEATVILYEVEDD